MLRLSLPSPCILITILGCHRELNCERPDACAMPALWLCGVRRSVVGPRPDAVVAGAATAGPGLMGTRVDSARRGCRVSRAAGWVRSSKGPVITQRAADMDRPFFTPGGVVWAPAGVSVQRQRRPEDATVCEVHSDIWGSRCGVAANDHRSAVLDPRSQFSHCSSHHTLTLLDRTRLSGSWGGGDALG